MIWYWHAGESVLICVDHTAKTATGFKIGDLRQAGWTINEREMTKFLPRFQNPAVGPPRIQPASKAMMVAEIAARSR